MNQVSMPDKSQLRYLWWATFGVLVVWAFVRPFVQQDNPPKMEPEPPVHIPVTQVPDFASIRSIKDKKVAFFSYLKPVVQQQNQRILFERSRLKAMEFELSLRQSLSSRQLTFLQQMAKKYKLTKVSGSGKLLNALLLRVDIVPEALVMSQGANESAWGTSRFARHGFNFFGLWCYRPGCGFVPSRRIAGGKHEVARFSSLDQGVAAYLLNLNTHNAYRGLRKIRHTLREGQQEISASRLAQGLMSYSERGQAYIDELQAMIRINRKYMSL